MARRGSRLLATAACAFLLPGTPSAAAAVWSVQTTPNPTTINDSNLFDVSCGSAKACSAVGSYVNGSTRVSFAEDWNGSGWSIHSTPVPPAALSSDLSSVSCTSANACIAVGTWATQLFPEELDVALVERWNGNHWSSQTTPSQAGATSNDLSGISCTSSKSCMAVGSYTTKGGAIKALAERWDGKRWRMEPAASPAHLQVLAGVSCLSANACTAVGFFVRRGGFYTLAERWDGKRWSIERTPNLANGQRNALGSISCTSSSSCMAVGYFESSNLAVQLTLAERWNGKKWAISGTLNPDSNIDSLGDVACTSSRACIAVGSAGGALLLERWNGGRWSQEHAANPGGVSGSDAFSGVSCLSASVCTAVGSYAVSGGIQATLAERSG